MKCSVRSYIQVHENGEALPSGKLAWVWLVSMGAWFEAVRVVDLGAGSLMCVFDDGAGTEWRCPVTMGTEFEMSAEKPEEAK